ncbi:putative membrane protein [Pacificibacter maritimus]|uniref:Putative membrane protein n=1 Tax=Pacificibacter maritimus TaxID=762213 RepID=A0A3N4UQR3_9RHOB|nr:DUF2177 family protein [Pacificibacter maritimus]RPE70995.1 putative membrane protein [Pacificibacter maritimus]
MQIIILYISTVVVFLGVDAVFLKNVLRPVFETHLNDWLLDDFRIGPAAVFYLAYIGGVLFFVSWPAMDAGSLTSVFWKAALLGMMAYGTYEFTNYATLTRWDPTMVAIDVVWGGVLTGLSASVGLWITRAVT